MTARIKADLPITKLRPPSCCGALLPRSRLVEPFSFLPHPRLTLIAAPCGFGKTALMAEIHHTLSAQGTAAAWLSLDASESNPRLFLAHLILAIQQALPMAGRDALAMLRPPPLSLEPVLSRLINDLSGAKNPLVLFLDDFHETDHPEVARLVSYFIRYLPAKIHLVLASERAFPPSLSWARARDWTLEFGWPDLCFSADEIRTYLLRICGLSCDDQRITLLEQHTEGWPGVIHPAACLLQRFPETPDTHLRRGDFAHALFEDMLYRQSSMLQEFLLETSILNQMTPGLCNTLRAREDSHLFLNELEYQHFLIRRSDTEELRYPQLLANFLRETLRRTKPECFRRLHHRAGHWHTAQGHHDSALNHWLHAGARGEAAELLTTFGPALLHQSSPDRLAYWLDRFAGADDAPAFLTLQAWCALWRGQPLTCLKAVDQAQRHPDFPPQSARQEECSLLRALAGLLRFNWLDSTAIHPDLPEKFREAPSMQRICARLLLGDARRHQEDLPGAQTCYRESAELAHQHNLPLALPFALQGLSAIDLLHARPDRVLARTLQWLDPLQPPDDRLAGLRPHLLFLHAQALNDTAQLDLALDTITLAIDSLEHGAIAFHANRARILRAQLHLQNGHLDAALADLHTARRHAGEVDQIRFHADLCETAIRLLQDDTAGAGHLLEQAHQMLEASHQATGENVADWQYQRCRWLLAQSRHDEVFELASSAENTARSAGRVRHVIDFLLLRALALQPGPDGLALGSAHVEEARKLAQPGGVRLPFRQLASALETFQSSAEAERAGHETALRYPERLHQREEQILYLLEQGLRNKDIAARLFLSDETVKWYLKRLYGNFAVENRIQLLATVRKLGLLAEQPH